MSGITLTTDTLANPASRNCSENARTFQRHQLTLIQRHARSRLQNWLSDLNGGVIHFSDSEIAFSCGSACAGALESHWTIHDPEFYSHLAASGSLGIAESWLRGQWSTDDLTSLLSLLCRNLSRVPHTGGIAARVRSQILATLNRLNGNTRKKSRRYIASHYDLSNEFFELFLDPTLMYSCAYFENAETTLHEASIAKLNRLCRTLKLLPEHQVLEIGTGWGGFAIHASGQIGCQTTSTTISQAQLTAARRRVRDAGLDTRIRLLDSDYRDLRGQYDRLVSIEMVEAVGERFLDTYCRQLGRLLKPGGRCVIQAIVMPEDRFKKYRSGIDFIQKYIFPGGFLPSVAALQESIGRTTNLRLDTVEDLSLHYAQTLMEWRRGFLSQLDAVRRLGFDDRFIRMWEYYLCYCEAAFREQTVRVVQIAWDKPVF